jgi:hypothetical protein
MKMATKCDIIRDAGYANSCGMCAALAASPQKPIPAGCTIGGVTPPAAACLVAGTANTRMKLFDEQYSPANLFEDAADKAARTLIEKNYLTGIQATETALAAAYPGAAPGATAVSWPDFELCLWNKTGARGGSNNNIYYKRNDLMQMGMQPSYPLGGAFAENTIWKSGAAPSPVPVSVDHVMNPDLFAFLMFALLVIIFAVLIWSAWKSAKKAPYLAQQKKDAERQRLEESDPFKGTAFESYPDPQAKCRAYVDSMEQQGYDMSYYRTQCGLPAKPE